MFHVPSAHHIPSQLGQTTTTNTQRLCMASDFRQDHDKKKIHRIEWLGTYRAKYFCLYMPKQVWNDLHLCFQNPPQGHPTSLIPGLICLSSRITPLCPSPSFARNLIPIGCALECLASSYFCHSDILCTLLSSPPPLLLYSIRSFAFVAIAFFCS
jgi:hypothetical protein